MSYELASRQPFRSCILSQTALCGEQVNCSRNSEWCLHLCNLWMQKTFVDSLKLFCYVEPNSKIQKERRQWQPKKEPGSPEARAKVPVREQRRARQNRSPEVALRNLQRQPKSRRRKLVRARRKRPLRRPQRKRPQRK